MPIIREISEATGGRDVGQLSQEQSLLRYLGINVAPREATRQVWSFAAHV